MEQDCLNDFMNEFLINFLEESLEIVFGGILEGILKKSIKDFLKVYSVTISEVIPRVFSKKRYGESSGQNSTSIFYGNFEEILGEISEATHANFSILVPQEIYKETPEGIAG